MFNEKITNCELRTLIHDCESAQKSKSRESASCNPPKCEEKPPVKHVQPNQPPRHHNEVINRLSETVDSTANVNCDSGMAARVRRNSCRKKKKTAMNLHPDYNKKGRIGARVRNTRLAGALGFIVSEVPGVVHSQKQKRRRCDRSHGGTWRYLRRPRPRLPL